MSIQNPHEPELLFTFLGELRLKCKKVLDTNLFLLYNGTNHKVNLSERKEDLLMFKKRLKGLLAMVLAGSIATTAIPLSASAAICGDISVVNANNTDNQNIEGVLNGYSRYLNANNLWAIYYHEQNELGLLTKKLECVEGNELANKLNTMNNSSNCTEVKIRYYHDILFTTADFTGGTAAVKIGDMKLYHPDTFPFDFSTVVSQITVDPLKEITSWTAWYNRDRENTTNVSTYQYTSSNSAQSSTFVNQTSTQINADVIKDLYQGNIDSLNYGKTIIELKTAYKTFNLPVLNTVLQQEKDAEGNDKTVSITNGDTANIDGYLEDFYLCYIDRTNNIVKISDNTMSTKSDVWDKLGDFISGITNFDERNLCLVRSVTARVYGRGREDELFTTKDFITGNIAGNSALRYLYEEAPAKSIWRVVANGSDKCFFATKDKIGDAINSCLTYKPNVREIAFTEYPFIYVTGTTPTADGSIASENKFLAETLKDDSLQTISELLAELAEEKPPASGKKYDVTGWELWSAGTDCGGLINLENTNFNTSGVTGVTADMFDKAGSKYPVIYFPQVDETQSGGGNSGGGNGGGGNGGSGSTGGNTGGNSGNTGSNTGGNSGGSSSRPEPSYDPNKPMIDGVEKSWSDVEKEIGKLPKGGTKTISLFGDRKVPADVIKAIKDSEAVVTFKINSAFSWTVDGSTLTDGDIHDYDFTIEMVTATGTEILRGDVGTSFIIGEITGNALLNINFKKGHEQEFANLYKKVDGKLVFVDNVRIDENGAAIGLEVSEAGEYVVMLGKFSDRAGDMDNDGIMDKKDSFAVINNFLEIEEGANPLVADMNGDGRINAKDALIIVQKFLGIE